MPTNNKTSVSKAVRILQGEYLGSGIIITRSHCDPNVVLYTLPENRVVNECFLTGTTAEMVREFKNECNRVIESRIEWFSKSPLGKSRVKVLAECLRYGGNHGLAENLLHEEMPNPTEGVG